MDWTRFSEFECARVRSNQPKESHLLRFISNEEIWPNAKWLWIIKNVIMSIPLSSSGGKWMDYRLFSQWKVVAGGGDPPEGNGSMTQTTACRYDPFHLDFAEIFPALSAVLLFIASRYQARLAGICLYSWDTPLVWLQQSYDDDDDLTKLRTMSVK